MRREYAEVPERRRGVFSLLRVRVRTVRVFCTQVPAEGSSAKNGSENHLGSHDI